MIVRLLCVLLFTVGPVAAQDTEERPGDRPNIVLIVADDLGYGDIGAYGADLIDTPNLDRLAENGIRLLDFYTAANVCTPSRAGLLTGRQPIRMGLAAGVIFPNSDHGLPPAERTLPEILSQAGYHTAMIGKWHLGHQPVYWPTNQGFDSFYGVPYSNDMSPFPLYRGEEVIEQEAEQATLTRRYTEEAVQVIEEAGDQPFFLYLAHTFPHIPLHASPEFRGRSQAGLYGDTVEEIDWSTGEILDALTQHEIADRTIIIVTSDNGPWFEGSSAALRDRKGGSWDGGYRVPFLATWPGVIPAGSVSEGVITGLDLLPTLLRLAGIETPAGLELDGQDVSALLAGESAAPDRTVFFFNEDQIVGARSGSWRLVTQTTYKTYDIPLAALGYPLLFDLRLDPQQRYNLGPDHPNVVQGLLEEIAAARKTFGVKEPSPNIEH
jgi:uncharacterized sulfatase